MPRLLLQMLIAFGLSAFLTAFGIVSLILQIEPGPISMMLWFPLGPLIECLGIPFVVAAIFQYPLLAAIYALAVSKLSPFRSFMVCAACYCLLLGASYLLYRFSYSKPRVASPAMTKLPHL